MGCVFSSKRFSATAEEPSKTIRVINLNGDIKYLEHPVTVAQVTGKPPEHMVFTHAQLLANFSASLKLDALLERGKVYFMLPRSLFKANMSPDDLAPVVKKLAAVAQNSKSQCKRKDAQKSSSGIPNRVCQSGQNSLYVKVDDVQMLIEMHKAARCRPWKPILATIKEMSSFNRRTQSDLQVNVKVDGVE